MDSEYDEALHSFWKKSNQQEKTKEFFATYRDQLGLKEARSMISVGPGPGDLDSRFIKACAPNLVEYYGIEPNKELTAKLCRRFNIDHPSIGKLHIFNEFAETWTGPTKPVDAILLLSVLYFVPKRILKEFIVKCWNWLDCSDGKMVITISSDCPFMKDIQKISHINCSREVRNTLVDLGYPFDEYSCDVRRDLRRPQNQYAEILFMRTPTPEEVEAVERCCEKYIRPGEPDGHLYKDAPYIVFVVHKRQNYNYA